MRGLIDLGSRFSLLACVLFLSFLALNQDTWMYRSDPLSLGTFVSGMALMLTLPMLGIALLISLLGRGVREAVAVWTSRLNLALLIGLFLILICDMVPGERIQGTFFYILLAVILGVSLVVSVRVLAQSATAARSLARMARLVLLLALLSFPCFKGLAVLASPGASPAGGGRGVVLIVVDRLSAQYLTPFNTGAETRTPHLDAFARESTVFPHAFTNGSDTFNAFRALYTGRYELDAVEPASNAVSRLQEAGVRTRLIVSHNDATPDIRELTYRGFRSYYLTEHYAFLARLLGMDYHPMLYRPRADGGHGKVGGWREGSWREGLNQGFRSRHPFEVLFDEMERLLGGDAPFFALCHFIIPTGFEPIQEEVTSESDIRLRIRQKVINGKNRYPSDLQWWADEEEKKYITEIEQIDRAFGAFWEKFKAAGWDQEVDVILTGDHGASFEDGKIWYGYHLNRPVVWIPLIMHRREGTEGVIPSGRDERLTDLTDLAPTLFELYGLGTESGSRGNSLLQASDKKTTVVFGANRPEHPKIPARYAVMRGDEKYLFGLNAQKLELRFDTARSVTDTGDERENPSPDQEWVRRYHGQSPWEAF